MALRSCRAGMVPSQTTARGHSGVGTGWSSFGRLREALRQHTAWHSPAWTLNKQEEHSEGEDKAGLGQAQTQSNKVQPVCV